MRVALFFLCLLPLTGWSQLTDMELAFHQEDKARLMSLYDGTEDSFRKAYIQYCLVVLNLARDRRPAAQAAIDLGLTDLAAVANGKDDADVLALWVALGGLKIALNPMTAMHQGPQNQRTLQRAIELDENNPTVWLVSGMSLINTPPAFGGGPKPALASLTRSIELFETETTHDRRWGHADAHAWRAQAYHRLQNSTKAEQELKKALSISPDFAWAKRLSIGLSQD